MKHQRTLSIAAAAATLAVLSACTGDAGGERVGRCAIADEFAAGTPVDATPSGEITFQTTALKASFSEYFTELIEEFEATYPGTTVTWEDDPGDGSFATRLVADAQACSLADVVNMPLATAGGLREQGFLADLDAASPGIGDNFIPSLWDSLVLPGDDHHYVLPWYWGLIGLQTYNTELMQRAGLDPEQPPTTFEELFDAADQVAERSNGEFSAFSASLGLRLPLEWQLQEAEVIADDGSAFVFADDPAVQEWTERMTRLALAGGIPKDSIASDDEPTALFTQGATVWGSPNASSLRYVQEGNPGVYEHVGVSSLLDRRGTAIAEVQTIGVPSTSTNPATAIAFARFLLDAEQQNRFISDPRIQNFPSTTESLGIPKLTDITGTAPIDEANRLAVDLADEAEIVTIVQWSDAVANAVNAELQLALTGKKAPREALQAAQDAANRVIGADAR